VAKWHVLGARNDGLNFQIAVGADPPRPPSQNSRFLLAVFAGKEALGAVFRAAKRIGIDDNQASDCRVAGQAWHEVRSYVARADYGDRNALSGRGMFGSFGHCVRSR
jgi:hypothetical protein